MKPTDIEKMKKLSAALSLIQNAVNELEGQRNVDFFKSVIKNKSIEIYELVTELELDEQPLNSKNQPETNSAIVEKAIPLPETPAIKEVSIIENTPVKNETVSETKVEPLTLEPEPVIEKKEEVVVSETTEVPALEKATEVIKVVETVKANPTEIAAESNTKKQDLHIENESLNERLSKNKQPVHNLVEKSKETPIADLAKAISISKKFEFINGLFDGKADAYKACLQTIQNANNIEEAYAFLENEIANTYEWDENEKLAEEFFSLTRRRFLK